MFYAKSFKKPIGTHLGMLMALWYSKDATLVTEVKLISTCNNIYNQHKVISYHVVLFSEFTFEYDPSANVAVPLNSMLRTDGGIEVIHHGMCKSISQQQCNVQL